MCAFVGVYESIQTWSLPGKELAVVSIRLPRSLVQGGTEAIPSITILGHPFLQRMLKDLRLPGVKTTIRGSPSGLVRCDTSREVPLSNNSLISSHVILNLSFPKIVLRQIARMLPRLRQHRSLKFLHHLHSNVRKILNVFLHELLCQPIQRR